MADPTTREIHNALKQFNALYSITSRMQMAQQLGLSYSGERDLYKAFGRPKVLNFEHYWALYDRGSVASRVVEAPCDASWRIPPKIQEDKDDTTNTEFEEAWLTLQKEFRLFHYIHKADISSGIGEYGVLLMGFDDGQDLSTPVTPSANLTYVQPYKQNLAQILKVDDDITSPRYGLPELYNLFLGVDLTSPESMSSSKAIQVHHSRILHIAEGLVDNRIFGTPRMKKCYNELCDLDKVAGSSAEMWYRGAFPGLNFSLDPEAQVSQADLENMNTQIEEYMHDFKRFLKLRGVKVESIAPQVADPRPPGDLQMDMISAATGIPKRILIGSERGELASDQDEKNWLDKIVFRRTNYCEPFILRPLIDRFMELDILPKIDRYTISWPELIDSSELDKASSIERKTTSITKYADSPGAQQIFPPKFYFTRVLDMTDEDYSQINAEVEGYVEDERAQIEEERELMRQEREQRMRQSESTGAGENEGE